MWYKEWRTVRLKFGMWLGLYGLSGLLFILLWPRNQQHLKPMWDDWVFPLFLLTVVVSVLGGIDTIAEEKNQQTIGFLLSQPIRRSRIYTVKVALNSLALLAAFGLTNAVVLLYDQLNPTLIILRRWNTVQTEPNTWYSGWVTIGQVSQSYDLGTALILLSLIALVGVGIVCLSALFSVLAQSPIQAIFATGIVLVIIGVLANQIGLRVDWGNNSSHNWLYTINPLSITLVLLAAVVSFVVGLLIFQRKAF